MGTRFIELFAPGTEIGIIPCMPPPLPSLICLLSESKLPSLIGFNNGHTPRKLTYRVNQFIVVREENLLNKKDSNERLNNRLFF